MTAKRISELTELLDPSTLTELPVAYGNVTYKIKLRNLKTGLNLDKSDVGLDRVDNTSDVDKPVSTAQRQALDQKADIHHIHEMGEVNGLTNAIDGLQQGMADVIRDMAGKASALHGHNIDEVQGLSMELTMRPTQSMVNAQIQQAIESISSANNTVDLVNTEW